MTNRILVFTTRQLCYNSASFFAAQMANELEDMGYECELCRLPDDGIAGSGTQAAKACRGADIDTEIQHCLENYIGKEYAAVLDFNSKLPRLVMEDGSYYLNHIDAPFYNYILDNPLYHHSTLECRLLRYHVILVDGNHCSYVRKYYPHIKSVDRIFLGASEAVFNKAFEEKKECVLFMGTYRNPDTYLEQIRAAGGQASCDMLRMIEIMKSDDACTMEAALKNVLSDTRREVTNREMALLMNYYYPVEMYLRNFYREELITSLLKGGIPVRITGDWWENYSYGSLAGVRADKPVRFDRSFDRIAEYAVIADSSPFFKDGVHDRVFAGMANRTAVLTDNNQYIEEAFVLQGIAAAYPIKDISAACDMAEELLTNRQKRRDMTERAYEEYQRGHTWKHTAQAFVRLLD